MPRQDADEVLYQANWQSGIGFGLGYIRANNYVRILVFRDRFVIDLNAPFRWFITKVWEIPFSSIESVAMERYFFFWKLISVVYRDREGGMKRVSFTVKDGEKVMRLCGYPIT
jgi:hypothetical protein